MKDEELIVNYPLYKDLWVIHLKKLITFWSICLNPTIYLCVFSTLVCPISLDIVKMSAPFKNKFVANDLLAVCEETKLYFFSVVSFPRLKIVILLFISHSWHIVRIVSLNRSIHGVSCVVSSR